MTRKLHFPESMEEAHEAKRSIFIKRLLVVQLQSQLDKEHYAAEASAKDSAELPDFEHVKTFLKQLPFELTRAQKRALKDILEDVHRTQPMMRLMQ